MTYNFIPEQKVVEKEITKEYLLTELSKYRRYLNKDVIDYLEAAINLNISILNDQELNVALSDLKIFREIAKYNIIRRTSSTIFAIPGMKEDYHIHIHNSNEYLTVSKMNGDTSYPLFNANLKGDEEGLIEIFDSDHNKRIDELINTIEKEKAVLQNLPKENYIGKDEFGKDMFMPTYGTQNNIKLFNAQQRVVKARKKLDELYTYGAEEDAITKLITSSLLSDWKMILEPDTTRSLGWAKIRRISK